MSQDLQLAVEYLAELDADLDARATDADPRARSAAREDMRYRLDRVRDLIGELEQTDPDARCRYAQDKHEAVFDLEETRIWCHIVEAKIMGICYGDHSSAIGLMQQALAIDPSRARNHAQYALFLSEARQHDNARAAIDRAINLEPETMTFVRIRESIVRADRPIPDPTPDYPWWHLGRYLT